MTATGLMATVVMERVQGDRGRRAWHVHHDRRVARKQTWRGQGSAQKGQGQGSHGNAKTNVGGLATLGPPRLAAHALATCTGMNTRALRIEREERRRALPRGRNVHG